MPASAIPLSALDDSFLAVESPTAHMHVGWAAVFEPPDAGLRPGFEELRAHIGAVFRALRATGRSSARRRSSSTPRAGWTTPTSNSPGT